MAKYRTKPKEIEAVKLIADMGSAVAGDWLIIDGQSQFFMSDEDFQKQFDEVTFSVVAPQVNKPVHRASNSDETPLIPRGFGDDYNPREGLLVGNQ